MVSGCCQLETQGKEVVKETQELNEVTLAMAKSTKMPPRLSALKSSYFPVLFLFLALFYHDREIQAA